jgi:hypothetical protein
MKKVSGAALIEEARGKRFFNYPISSPQVQTENARSFRKKNPDEFSSTQQAHKFLENIIVPPTFRWAFSKNAKTATTSAVHFLFKQEFDVPLNASWINPNDVNTSAAGHNLDTYSRGIFRPLAYVDHSLNIFENTLRLVTARHPVTRAKSSFSYICKTQEFKHIYFSMDRALMCAIVGFDWEVDIYTAKGFEKFLDYISIVRDEYGIEQVDGHWKPQVSIVKPRVFKPDIIGRTENMEAFYKEVAERLGEPLAAETQQVSHNAQAEKAENEVLFTPNTLRKIEEVYAEDFEWLGEDPHHF